MEVTARPRFVAAGGRIWRMVSTLAENQWSMWIGWLSVAAAGLPMLIAAGALTFQRPDFVIDGDAAVDEIALMRAVRFVQLVGNYSRFGWSHLGPAWFYALAIIYAPLGQQSWAFFVASLVVQAVFASLIVAAAWRIRGMGLAAVTSVLLLLSIFGLGLPVFRFPWPPFATVLPIILFFLLAAYGAAGSTLAIVGALLVGSYEAQVHIGTVPTIALGLAVMTVLRLLWGPRSLTAILSGFRQRRLPAVLLALGLITLVAMWVPVLIDQVTSRPSNLSKLVDFFFLKQGPDHPIREGIGALGRQLVALPFRQPPDLLESDAELTPGRLLAVIAFLALSGVLAAVATVLRDRFAQATGILLFVATIGLSWSISHIVGDLYAYLILWTATLPLLLLIGWTALIARIGSAGIRHFEWSRLLAVPRRSAVALAVLVMLILASVQTVDFLRFPSPSDGPGTRNAAGLVEKALATEPRQPILVTITSSDAWPTAAGVALQLMKQGWSLSFGPDYVFMFGEGLRASGREGLELLIVPESNLDAIDQHAPRVRYVGSTLRTDACPLTGAPCIIYLFTRTLPGHR